MFKKSGHKVCEKKCGCCEKAPDCCTPQFLILDKLRQGWSDVSVSGGQNIPLELAVDYSSYSSIDASDVSGTGVSDGNTYDSSANVVFNNVYDRYGNKVPFPGNGNITFEYQTYADVSGNSNNIEVNWAVANNVYGSLINLGTVNSTCSLFGKFYAYFYYTTDTTGSFLRNPTGIGDVVTSVTNNLYQGWRGMSWSQYITSQIPYSSNTPVTNNAEPDVGFADMTNGQYNPPSVVPTSANVYSNTPVSSYEIVYDNVLWAYLFVNTHRYSSSEICCKSDQVLGWYANTGVSQLILLQDLPELGLVTTNDLLTYSTTPYEDLSRQDCKKYRELQKLYDLTLRAINAVNNDPKECGNIVEVEICCERWLVAINTANSNLSWSENNNEFAVVVSKL
jgi:hypothetical protein